MFGIRTGAFVHVVFAAVGLSAILATSATAFTLVKWIGAAYLIWLGVQAFRHAGAGLVAAGGPLPPSTSAIFRQGVLVAALNPKVAIFFLAFLPLFGEPGAGPASAQLFPHGCLVIVVAAMVEPPLVLAGARLAKSLRENLALARWLDRGLGSLFLFLGVRLAVDQR